MITALKGTVPRVFFVTLLGLFGVLLPSMTCHAEGLSSSQSRFVYRTRGGQVTSVRIIRHFTGRIRPPAAIDPRIDSRLRRAVTIAEERANARTKARCWRYVKEALLAAGAVSSYPKTNYACQAGDELVRNYGFKRLPIRDPYQAPLGAVIVYGKGSHGAGHVELRTKTGFVSDYRSRLRCYYPVIAVYAKFSS